MLDCLGLECGMFQVLFGSKYDPSLRPSVGIPSARPIGRPMLARLLHPSHLILIAAGL